VGTAGPGAGAARRHDQQRLGDHVICRVLARGLLGGGAQVLLDPPSKVQCKRDTIYMQRLFGFFFFLLLFFFAVMKSVCMEC